MRILFTFIFVLALGVMGCSETAGTGGSGGDGGSGGTGGVGGAFAPGDPVTVSGDSPFAACDTDTEPGAIFTLDSEVEPWIAVNPADPDNLAVIWMQDRYTDGASRGHVSASSFDGGATWGQPVVTPGLTPCSDGDWERTSDPWLAFATNGDLYSTSLPSVFNEAAGARDFSIVVNKSIDGGGTWSDPALVDEVVRPLRNDKQSITADPFDECSIYLIWSRFDGEGGGDVLFSRTSDCGATWGDPRVVHTSNPFTLGAQVAVLPDGVLVAFFKVDGLNPIQSWPLYAKQSTDGGETWPGEPVEIAATRRGPPQTPDGEQEVMPGIFDIAVDRGSGALYAVWEELFEEPLAPTRVAFSSSDDGGLTWSTPVRVDQTPPDTSLLLEQAFLPSVEVSGDGIIGVTYYDFQNDTPEDSRSDTDHWFTHCDPDVMDCTQADSWSDGVRLTESSFDLLAAPVTRDRLFLGDYVGLASTGSDFVAFFSVTTEDDPANAIFVPIRGR